jgi:hypothetical protein
MFKIRYNHVFSSARHPILDGFLMFKIRYNHVFNLARHPVIDVYVPN